MFAYGWNNKESGHPYQWDKAKNECTLTYKISRSKRYDVCSDVVRLKGLEPTRIAAREPKGDVTLVKVKFWLLQTFSQYTQKGKSWFFLVP